MLKTYRGDMGAFRLALAAAGFKSSGQIWNDKHKHHRRLKLWFGSEVNTQEKQGGERYLMLLSNLQELFGDRLLSASSTVADSFRGPFGSFCVYLEPEEPLPMGNAPRDIAYPASVFVKVKKTAPKEIVKSDALGKLLYTRTLYVYEHGILVVTK